MDIKEQLCEILLGKHLKDLRQLEEDAVNTFQAINLLPDNVYYGDKNIAESKAITFDELISGSEEKYIDSILDDLERFIGDWIGPEEKIGSEEKA